jgi:S-adenosylmethionine:tRNA ribosyltransferase-isomerase
MKTSDFDYELPQELIAQTPLDRRDSSRLLVLDKKTGAREHRQFSDIAEYLVPGDVLVLNDSRVIPARLLGARETGGAAELLLLNEKDDGRWECLARPGKRLKAGARVIFGNGELVGVIDEVMEDGNRLVRFEYEGIFLEVLERLGKMPLPPYIKKELKDGERYQTVYSKNPGSAAAPTAGLHFTPELLEALKAKGVELCFLTLHVGLGTFRPVKEEDVEDHLMHEEYCVVSREAADMITAAKREGRRVVSCGTTSCRTLEALSKPDGTIEPFAGNINIFIYPGYKFKCIDALITNFHLPESTLIMLVSAFAGREKILEAYKEAVEMSYRFFSFGDAMFIH